MPKELIVSEAALKDFEEIGDWYDSKRAGLSVEFADDARASLRSILEFPEFADWVSENVRRKQMKRFPFVIYFDIEEHAIVVRGVFHTSRATSVWKRRFNE